MWTCAGCGRQFGRRGQSHECAPALSLDEYFSNGPERERPIFDAVADHLETVGPVAIEAVSVGILFKRESTFAELRPKVNWVALSFWLSRTVEHGRIARRIRGTGVRTCHFVNLRSADEVDGTVRDWLTESYLASPARS